MNISVIMNEAEVNTMVEHPTHYNAGNFECIDMMENIFGKGEVMAFCKLNAFKYLWRAKMKGKEAEDIAKASWYLKKYTELSK